jgi:spore coat protein CotH
MAYDVYRRAGNAAPLTDFVRLWVDGRPVGYHLLIENPSRSFLRRNKVDDGGNLYKIIWYGNGLVGTHEKRTNRHGGHEDLIKLVDQLRRTSGDAQWKVIQENFDVRQVATYFAVNMVLDHWDGYFNNYFTYHDPKTNRWQMYPWDQDKTWGYYDGIPPGQVFTTLPLNFGMEGARPPHGQGGGPFGGGGINWWRDGGVFSKPLLANPQFRKVFLARVKEILDNVYTEQVYFPLLDETAERLKEDVKIRAKVAWGDVNNAQAQLAENVQLLRTHLTKRREFLLAQPELKAPATTRPQ